MEENVAPGVSGVTVLWTTYASQACHRQMPQSKPDSRRRRGPCRSRRRSCCARFRHSGRRSRLRPPGRGCPGRCAPFPRWSCPGPRPERCRAAGCARRGCRGRRSRGGWRARRGRRSHQKPSILVVPDHPVARGVGVDAACVAVVADVRPASVGQLDARAGDGTVVDEIAGVRGVDLDGLLAGIDDVDVVDEGASVARRRPT